MPRSSANAWHALPQEEYARRKQEVWETGFGAVTAAGSINEVRMDGEAQVAALQAAADEAKDAAEAEVVEEAAAPRVGSIARVQGLFETAFENAEINHTLGCDVHCRFMDMLKGRISREHENGPREAGFSQTDEALQTVRHWRIGEVQV